MCEAFTSQQRTSSPGGLNGMKPSSSAGSHSSFIRFLASSLVSFSPRFTSSLNSSNSRMVSSAFLS